MTYEIRVESGWTHATVRACGDPGERFSPWRFPLERASIVDEGAIEGGVLLASEDGCVRYRVPLEVSLRQGDAVVVAQDSFLVRRVGSLAPARIRFVLPPGAKVATAWPATTGGDADATEFSIPASGMGLPSDVVLGRFATRAGRVTGAELRLVRLDGPLPFSEDEVAAHVAEAAEMVASVGGAFPVPRVLAVIVPTVSDEAVHFGLTKRGGGGSIVLLFGEGAAPGSLHEDWVTVHELAHLLHPRLRNEDRWITEGIATYYQEVLRVRFGWLAPEQAWGRIAQGFASGRDDGTGRALADEAAAMRRTRAFRRVYWAGTSFTLEADLALRREGSSLDEAIARCLREIERRPEPMEGVDFVAMLGEELVPLGEAYAERSSWPDTDARLARLGVVWSGEGEARLVEGDEAALRDAIMSREPGPPSRPADERFTGAPSGRTRREAAP